MVHRLSILVILLALLAACGGAPAATAPTSAPPPTAQSTAPTVEPTFAPAAATRTITDARGEQVVVPATPQRVVALTEHDLDSALALGITPVGAVNGRGQPGLPAYLGERISGIESVGSLAEPSLETIIGLNPDLILAGNLIPQIEALLPELTQIAPVVKTYSVGEDWKTAFVGTADALNRVAEAEAFLANYEARVSAIRAMLPADRAVEASVVRWMPEGPVVMMPSIFSSLVLADIGLTRPAAQAALAGSHGAHSDPVSMEQLELIDGDWIFIGALNAEGSVALEAARTNPLFQQLDAVQAGHVAVVDGAVWTSIGGPLAALQVLDDVAAALAAAPAAEGATRTITHAMGTTEVPAVPQRVVVLDTGEVDNALALGAPIVGAPVAEVLEYQAYLAEQLDGIADIGTISEPSLEAILALKPDLILGSKQRYEAIYDQLATIAPTVFVESLRVPWQDNFRLHAEALGKTTEAEQLLAAYAERTAAVQAAIGTDPPTISVIRFRPDQVRLYLKSSYIGYILQDVGLPRPPSQDAATFSAEIGLEQIADVDADYIFITGYAQDDSELATFLESPLWQTLGAVQNERAIDVDDDHWIAGLGVQSANLVLDDLERILGAAE
jgi:iron complex transport system substrate-binding protein